MVQRGAILTDVGWIIAWVFVGACGLLVLTKFVNAVTNYLRDHT